MKPFRIYYYGGYGKINRLPSRYRFDHDTLEDALSTLEKLRSKGGKDYVSHILKSHQIVIVHYYNYHESKIVKLIEPKE